MLPVDFIGKNVIFRFDCDKAIDSSPCSKVSVRLNDGATFEEWLETEDYRGLYFKEGDQCAFPALLQSARMVEIRVPSCTTDSIDSTFDVEGFSRISRDATSKPTGL